MLQKLVKIHIVVTVSSVYFTFSDWTVSSSVKEVQRTGSREISRSEGSDRALLVMKDWSYADEPGRNLT